MLVLASLPVDLCVELDTLPRGGGTLTPASSVGLELGGGCNVAIVAARLGLDVAVLGEIGEDRFGQLVLDELRAEGVDTAGVIVSRSAATPLVLALVDSGAEPAYIYLRDATGPRALSAAWQESIRGASELFVGGWSDHAAMSRILLDALALARAAGVPGYFDPGPGNPDVDEGWHLEAAAQAAVVLATMSEAARLTGLDTPERAARALLGAHTNIVIIKQGAQGCTICTADELVQVPALEVAVVDTSGAGDSLAAAVVAGVRAGLEPRALGQLANAAGAAAVSRAGAGRRLPARAEVVAMLGAAAPELVAALGW